MKYIICCDFATMKCSRKEFAQKLETFCNHYKRCNDYIWEIEVDELALLPYGDNDCETLYQQLSEFVSPDSFLKICKVSQSFGNDAP